MLPTILSIASAMALSAAPTPKFDSLDDINNTDPDNRGQPNFHKILEILGKTCLRPGGRAATEKLIQSSGLTSDHRLLELSAGLGKTGILFAQTTGCQVLITDRDDDRLEQAKKTIKCDSMLPSSRIETRAMDMFDIDGVLGVDSHFDSAITEASLTHYPLHMKKQFFRNLGPHTDQYLLHEICYKSNEESVQMQVQEDMQKVLKIGFYPETKETWIALMKESGFDNIRECEVGDIGILNPSSLLRDEGLKGVARIAKNIVTHPYARSRVFATRKALSAHRKDLGYIIICADKKDGQ